MKLTYITFAAALLSIAAAESLVAECALSGEVFTVDPVGETILVKDDGGYLKLVEVDGRTTFTFRTAQQPGVSNLAAVNSGDLVCVEFSQARAKFAEHIIDLPRTEVHARQREWVAKWQKSLVRGRLDRVLKEPDRLVLDTGASSLEITVPAGTPVRLYSSQATELEDGRDGSFSQLHPGLLLSVRANSDERTGSLTARSIYTGGVTSVAGTITAIHTLRQTVSIREFGTGRSPRSGSPVRGCIARSLRTSGRQGLMRRPACW